MAPIPYVVIACDRRTVPIGLTPFELDGVGVGGPPEETKDLGRLAGMWICQ